MSLKGTDLPCEAFSARDSRDMTAEHLRRLLNNVKHEGRTLCATADELVQKLLKNQRSSINLLRPRNGSFNLASIFQLYCITNSD